MMLVISLAAQVALCASTCRADADCVVPATPTNLTATAKYTDDGDLGAQLTWSPEPVSIQRSLDGVTWERINCGYSLGRYTDTYELQPLTTYYYRVLGHVCGSALTCVSAPSNIASATTLASPNATPTPAPSPCR